MNKLIFIILLFVVSCDSTEKKIKDSLFFQRGVRRNATVEIYDTLYSKTAIENLEFFENRSRFLINSIKMANEYRDSILLLQYPKTKQDSLLKIGFLWKINRQRELNNIYFKQKFAEDIYHEMNDTIAGYYVKIITKDYTDNFIVNPKFQIICPVYMYENK